MKIRNGFVSNSSSSSFLVEVRGWNFDKDRKTKSIWIEYVDAATRKKLTRYGFVFTNQNLETIENSHDVGKAMKPRQAHYMGYYVMCNEDEVIHWLMKNKISFKANVHYGHETMLYDAKKDEVVLAMNFGDVLAMYGVDHEELFDMKKIKKYVKGTSKQYMEGKLRL